MCSSSMNINENINPMKIARIKDIISTITFFFTLGQSNVHTPNTPLTIGPDIGLIRKDAMHVVTESVASPIHPIKDASTTKVKTVRQLGV